MTNNKEPEIQEPEQQEAYCVRKDNALTISLCLECSKRMRKKKSITMDHYAKTVRRNGTVVICSHCNEVIEPVTEKELIRPWIQAVTPIVKGMMVAREEQG